MLLFYIRHGDPVYDPDTLTPLGERQAEALAKRLALYGVDEIYASTSERARLTAKPTAELLKKEIKLLDFCNEKYAADEFAIYDDGERDWVFQILKYKQLFSSSDIMKLGCEWYNHPAFKEYRFKEGMERINRETDAFLSGLGYEHDREKKEYKVIEHNDKKIALFAHLGFGMSFLSSVLDIPYPIVASHFTVGLASMTVIDFNEEKGVSIPRLLTLANDSHIYREGLPFTHYNGMMF